MSRGACSLLELYLNPCKFLESNDHQAKCEERDQSVALVQAACQDFLTEWLRDDAIHHDRGLRRHISKATFLDVAQFGRNSQSNHLENEGCIADPCVGKFRVQLEALLAEIRMNELWGRKVASCCEPVNCRHLHKTQDCQYRDRSYHRFC
jgi:hypothetical protein